MSSDTGMGAETSTGTSTATPTPSPDTTPQPTPPPQPPPPGGSKVRTGTPFFVALLIATAAIALLAFAPALLGGSALVSSQLTQNILAVAVAFLVAAFIFGLIGDSTASITGEGQRWGLPFQLGGSAAGFVIFYSVITFGLSSVSTLSVTVLDTNGNRVDDSLRLRLVVDQRPLQTLSVQQARADFAYLPKGQNVPIDVEPKVYAVTSVDPPSCKEGGARTVIKASCSSVALTIARVSLLPIDFDRVVHDGAGIEAKLANVLDTLRKLLQGYLDEGGGVPQIAAVRFTSAASQYAELIFPLARQYTIPTRICTQLADIASGYNRHYPQAPVGLALVGATIEVFALSENHQPTGEVSCRTG